MAAQVGVNKGDGVTYEVVDGSYTHNIVDVDTLQSGYYIWDVTNNIITGSGCGGMCKKGTASTSYLGY